ncbi:nicotinate phosphoribosyltransferase [Bacillus pacificus]|nr:nicotinate phosphoribosyltransferase [Bacillus pacificus]
MKTTFTYKKNPATLLCDFYKISHRKQYPLKTEVVYSTWTPRKSLKEGIDSVVAFGAQLFVKKWLMAYFDENFFNRQKKEIVEEYTRIIKYALGDPEPDTTHIEALHELGYLPIRIRAVKEGTIIPIRVPMLTIENTDSRFFWLPNYLETMMSAELWMPTTAATIAFQYRKIFEKYAEKTSTDKEAIKFQGHDFHMRGAVGIEASPLAGMGHLLSFAGTDTIPAIWAMEQFYNADVTKEMVGASIPATEHSVQCANADDNQDELETFKRFATEVYPTGIFSIVSDTYDFWDNIGRVLPELKDIIMSRDGKVVIRPDSGIPEDILCGDSNADNELARKGLIQCLWEIFGGTVNEKGYKVLDPHIGAIYGDAITTVRAETICARLEEKGFASTNVVLGIGSFTYQFNTRDTFGFAMKATDVFVDGQEKAIFKDPKTDSGTKKSQKGRVIVRHSPTGLEFVDGLNKLQQEALDYQDLLEDVFVDGKLVRDESLKDIRERLTFQI